MPTTSTHSPSSPPGQDLRTIRRFFDVGLGLVVLVAALVGLAYWWVRAGRPQMDGTLHLPGLQGPVTVIRDTRGIPHITATNIHDLYFAEGYVMAQDRLWQMDLMRRLGEGRLAEIFGVQAFPTDRNTRLLGLNHAADEAAAHLQPQEAALLDAFDAGVNANIARRRWTLPIEFAFLRYRPGPWRPRDTFAIAAYMYQVLSSNYEDKLTREAFTKRLGPTLAAQAFPDHSPWDVVPGAKPPAPANEFNFRGFGRGFRFGPPGFRGRAGRAGRGGRGFGAPYEPAPTVARGVGVTENHLPVFNAPLSTANGPASASKVPGFWAAAFGLAPSGISGGSNDWVVSGARSFNGKPILANDPHLQFQIPGLWWADQLTAPGINVAGVSIIGVPGVIIGHNNHIAWGVTNTRADVQDLYRETLDGRGNVLTPTGWQPLKHWRETIKIRGQAPASLDVRVTPHGPIVASDAGGSLALDWSLYAPGALQSVHVFLAIDEAKDWKQFDAALAQFPGPTQNFVYADTAGHIAYQCAGWVPLRPPGDDGSIPVPGETNKYNWLGWIPFSKLPQVVDPADGVLATANSRVTPDHDPVIISTDWDAPNRTRRIYQLLGMLNHWNPSAMSRVQTDTVSEEDGDFAQAVVSAARNLAARGVSLNATTRQAVAMLSRFGGSMNRDSPAPTLAVQTRAEFLRQVLAGKVGDVTARAYHWDESPVFVQWLLAKRPAQWLPADAKNSWDGLLVDSLTAVAERDTLQPSALRWGRFETLSINHPVLSHIPFLSRLADLGPVQINGSPLTIKQARNVALGNATDLGPSMRFIADLSDWNRSTLTLVAGESGSVFSRHYRDEFSDYLRGIGLPLWFTPAAVKAHQAHDLHLVP